MRYIKKFNELFGGGKFKDSSDNEVLKLHLKVLDKINEFSYLLSDVELGVGSSWTTDEWYDMAFMLTIDKLGYKSTWAEARSREVVVNDIIRSHTKEILEYFDRIVDIIESEELIIRLEVIICNRHLFSIIMNPVKDHDTGEVVANTSLVYMGNIHEVEYLEEIIHSRC